MGRAGRLRWVFALLSTHCGVCEPPQSTSHAEAASEQASAATTTLAADGGIPAAYDRPVDDVLRWVDAHHLTAGVIGDTCYEIAAGVPLAPGLLCRARPPEGVPMGPTKRTVERIYRSDGVRLVEVWKGTVGIAADWVGLFVDLSPDGSRLLLRDATACGCEKAVPYDPEKMNALADTKAVNRELDLACSGRGVYLWSGTRYIKDSDASAVGPACARSR
jgi:hypothetical protein